MTARYGTSMADILGQIDQVLQGRDGMKRNGDSRALSGKATTRTSSLYSCTLTESKQHSLKGALSASSAMSPLRYDLRPRRDLKLGTVEGGLGSEPFDQENRPPPLSFPLKPNLSKAAIKLNPGNSRNMLPASPLSEKKVTFSEVILEKTISQESSLDLDCLSLNVDELDQMSLDYSNIGGSNRHDIPNLLEDMSSDSLIFEYSARSQRVVADSQVSEIGQQGLLLASNLSAIDIRHSPDGSFLHTENPDCSSAGTEDGLNLSFNVPGVEESDSFHLFSPGKSNNTTPKVVKSLLEQRGASLPTSPHSIRPRLAGLKYYETTPKVASKLRSVIEAPRASLDNSDPFAISPKTPLESIQRQSSGRFVIKSPLKTPVLSQHDSPHSPETPRSSSYAKSPSVVDRIFGNSSELTQAKPPLTLTESIKQVTGIDQPPLDSFRKHDPISHNGDESFLNEQSPLAIYNGALNGNHTDLDDSKGEDDFDALRHQMESIILTDGDACFNGKSILDESFQPVSESFLDAMDDANVDSSSDVLESNQKTPTHNRHIPADLLTMSPGTFFAQKSGTLGTLDGSSSERPIWSTPRKDRYGNDVDPLAVNSDESSSVATSQLRTTPHGSRIIRQPLYESPNTAPTPLTNDHPLSFFATAPEYHNNGTLAKFLGAQESKSVSLSSHNAMVTSHKPSLPPKALAKPVLHSITFQGAQTNKTLHVHLVSNRTGALKIPLTLINAMNKKLSWSIKSIGPCHQETKFGKGHTIHSSVFHISILSGELYESKTILISIEPLSNGIYRQRFHVKANGIVVIMDLEASYGMDVLKPPKSTSTNDSKSESKRDPDSTKSAATIPVARSKIFLPQSVNRDKLIQKLKQKPFSGLSNLSSSNRSIHSTAVVEHPFSASLMRKEKTKNSLSVDTPSTVRKENVTRPQANPSTSLRLAKDSPTLPTADTEKHGGMDLPTAHLSHLRMPDIINRSSVIEVAKLQIVQNSAQAQDSLASRSETVNSTKTDINCTSEIAKKATVIQKEYEPFIPNPRPGKDANVAVSKQVVKPNPPSTEVTRPIRPRVDFRPAPLSIARLGRPIPNDVLDFGSGNAIKSRTIEIRFCNAGSTPVIAEVSVEGHFHIPLKKVFVNGKGSVAIPVTFQPPSSRGGVFEGRLCFVRGSLQSLEIGLCATTVLTA